MASSRLGIGLNALIDSSVIEEQSASTEIGIELLVPNPWQPRRDFNSENLDELASSIKNQGIIQPLLVRELPDKTFQIVAGERRWRAAKLAGLTTIPVYIRHMTDDDVMTCALIENLQREDLNPIEEALALKTLRDKLNLTQEALSNKLGRSRSFVANVMRLLQLSPEAQEDVRTGKLSAGHARALLSFPEPELMEQGRKYILEHSLSVREAEDIVNQWKLKGVLPWDTEEPCQEPNEATEPTYEEKPAATPEKKPRKVSEIAKKMESLIGEVLQCKTVVRGSLNKGKITICYGSSDELQSILLKIGAETLNQKEQKEETKTEPEDQAKAANCA
ncbi:MAG: ParB/RepB/Spo0J family partition protein [Desulfovibrio sp.]|nr:ParB/RepB/Spo0J family partition protein [Desulfovibrio sp.]